jgi:hypothetical protein
VTTVIPGLRRLIWILAASLALPALHSTEAAAARQSAYFRIKVSPDSYVYGVIWRDQLRLAATPEALTSATPIKPAEVQTWEWDAGWGRRGTNHNYTYPETTLPVPRDRLPTGCDGLAVSLNYYIERDRRGGAAHGDFGAIYGQIALCRKDQAGTEWSYWCWTATQAGGRPREAPAFDVPSLGNLHLEVTAAEPKGGEVGIAVHVMSGRLMLHDIRRGGGSAPISLEISDGRGELVASETGDLIKFGHT